MNTFSIIAIPFFALSVVLLTLGATRKNLASFIVGGLFMALNVVNAVSACLFKVWFVIVIAVAFIGVWFRLCELWCDLPLRRLHS